MTFRLRVPDEPFLSTVSSLSLDRMSPDQIALSGHGHDFDIFLKTKNKRNQYALVEQNIFSG